MRNKILSLLVLLMTVATGAWAQGYDVTFSGFADDNLNTTIQVESLPQSFTQINGYELESSALEVVGDNSDHYALVQVTESCNGMVGVSINPTTITVHGAFEGTAAILFRGVDGNYNAHNRTIYVTCVEKPAVDVTISPDKKEAIFTMPEFDATAEYELVRDLGVKVAFDGVPAKARVAKNSEGKWQIADQFSIGLFDLIDAAAPKEITARTDIAFTVGKMNPVDYEGHTYYVFDEESAVSVIDFLADAQPGYYAIMAKAKEDGEYDGVCMSNPFTLFMGYEVTVGAREYATYYKDEALTIDDENALLYTITEVNDTSAILSDAVKIMPKNTPMLIFNKSQEAQTFILIPTEDEADEVDVADEFRGTLEPVQMPASTEGEDYYVCTGNEFVWVKYAGEIAANKCWLEIIAQRASARANSRSITGGNGDTTGLKAVDSGELTGDSYYDLQGRKVLKPQRKGVYIKSGQKVIVK